MQRLRDSPWAAVNLTGVAVSSAGQKEIGRIVNLSFSGAKLEFAAPLGQQGDAIELSLKTVMDELKTTLTLPAVIRHVGRPGVLSANPEAIEYGVEFGKLEPQDHLWLKCLVYQHIAEGHLI
jgi:hypothetical protein